MRPAWRAFSLRTGVTTFLLVMTLVVQTAVLSFIPLFGVRPDLLLVVIISVGFLRGPLHGVLLGALGGFLADMLTGQLIGLGLVVTALMGFLAGLVGLRIVREKVAIPVLLGVLGSALHLTFYALGARAFGIALPVFMGMLVIAPALALYNAALMLVVHPLVVRVSQTIDQYLAMPRRPN